MIVYKKVSIQEFGINEGYRGCLYSKRWTTNFRKFWNIKSRLIWKLRGYSENQYIRWSQFIHQNWKQAFGSKLVYILGTTVQDKVLDNYFQQIVSGQVSSFWCFQYIFEINWYLFLVFFLLTLNVLLLAGYVLSKVT